MDRKNVFELKKEHAWSDITVERKEGFGTSLTGYHKHSYYEINLILSGDVKILLGDRTEDGFGGRMVLTSPDVPHYISCDDNVLYKRIYLLFTRDFIDNRLPEWNRLSLLFGRSGSVFSLSDNDMACCLSVIDEIERETDPLSRRLLTYYLLSRLSNYISSPENIKKENKLPAYVIDALSYIESNYSKRFNADDVANELHIGRTTLLTGFKKHTGITFGEYSARCRLSHAIGLLSAGQTLELTAQSCGFADVGGLIRSFKKYFGATPRKYVTEKLFWGQKDGH